MAGDPLGPDRHPARPLPRGAERGRRLKPSRKGGKAVAKSDLPSKTCLTCSRPFTWRKKWAKDWESVKYCSDSCRSRKITPM
ncbi:DUF2256 domain-containing protein [uncultured Caulobacter sp.]|uniref:DUF2256 domain-containing protein n=1 Tax=uncultured Caulobacter sp. TaxID=158749 RepID=UPI0026088911|nr:DUF2256 domain-containing protein [uncultured Caulobacter sp.]